MMAVVAIHQASNGGRDEMSYACGQLREGMAPSFWWAPRIAANAVPGRHLGPGSQCIPSAQAKTTQGLSVFLAFQKVGDLSQPSLECPPATHHKRIISIM